MLLELRVRNLGVIAELHLVFGAGMTALTGETGAGKTFVVEAIELLVGGRADPTFVRSGASEAVVEGRFAHGDGEVILRRVVAAEGRSRAYVDGHMATVSALVDWGRQLVDLHGQHAHQSLLSAASQREALDTYAATSLGPWMAARARRVALEEQIVALGGDERSRAREIDLLRFQVNELDGAVLVDPEEDDALAAEEEALAEAAGHREAAGQAYDGLAGDGAALDHVRAALVALTKRGPFVRLAERLQGLVAEGDDIAAELRSLSEEISEDPERLAGVRARRQLLVELRRKYGHDLADVIGFHGAARERLEMLTGHDEVVAKLQACLEQEAADEAAAAGVVSAERRAAAPAAAAAVATHLRLLALPGAALEIAVGGPAPSDDVTFLFAANDGEAPLPLVKVASGGELARVMLALRLVLTEGPPTMVFDEVDAGVGGEAAVAVGRSLARLAQDRQVLVVTHLPQVAAFAHRHVRVSKSTRGGRTEAAAVVLDDAERVVELSRMLAGRQDSANARRHAQELLAEAAGERSA